jgi:hypothetical protein
MNLSRLQSADGLGTFGAVAIDEVIAASVERTPCRRPRPGSS